MYLDEERIKYNLYEWLDTKAHPNKSPYKEWRDPMKDVLIIMIIVCIVALGGAIIYFSLGSLK